jgi:hypothetical protein
MLKARLALGVNKLSSRVVGHAVEWLVSDVLCASRQGGANSTLD